MTHSLSPATAPEPPRQSAGDMPEGAEFERQIRQRNGRSRLWLAFFQVAIIVSIVALGALLFNIINMSFGLVAVQNEVSPATVVIQAAEVDLLAAPNTVSGEDDTALAAAVAADANAIGVFGFAYLQEQGDALRAVPIDGVAPSAVTVEDGSYSLARPLYLYADGRLLREQPQVAAFLQSYLAGVNGVIEEVGYFPASPETLTAAETALAAALASAKPGDATTGEIAVGGSSTVYPLTQRLAGEFVAAGFSGEIQVESSGTRAGLAGLCGSERLSIAAASRAINRYELDQCKKARVELVEMRIGTDALAIAVSAANEFVTGLSPEQLKVLFGGVELWSGIEGTWPAQPVMRFVPGADSGTLDFLVEHVYGDLTLTDLPRDVLEAAVVNSVSAGVLRRLERDKPMAERTDEELAALVNERVIKPRIVASWPMVDSLFDRTAIEAAVAESFPEAEIVWRNWVNMEFLTSPQSSIPEQSGVRTAILGSLLVIIITAIFSVPVGIGAAIYLEEYAKDSRINQIIQTNIDNLAGVPSIIYGILGLAVFVRLFEPLTSGNLFGLVDPTTANGRTILSAGLTLGLLVMPVIIINAQEAIRAVPRSLREAAYGLGATKWQVIWSHVLSNALPGILTGTILAMSRAIGETAPLVVVGASTFISVDPTNAFSKFTVLPMQIYQWTSRPQPEFKHIAAAAGIVLIVLLLMLNMSAIYLRNRYSKRV
jgi:phosphate transport system permease protein